MYYINVSGKGSLTHQCPDLGFQYLILVLLEAFRTGFRFKFWRESSYGGKANRKKIIR